MTQTAVAAQIHQTLDVHSDFTTQVAFNAVLTVDQFTDLYDLVIRQFVDALRIGDTELAADCLRGRRANAVDIAQADDHPLVGRNVYAGNTCHANSPIDAIN